MKIDKIILACATIVTTLLLTTSCAKRITQHPSPNTQHPTPNTQHPTPASAQTLQLVNSQRSGLTQVSGKLSLSMNAGGRSVSLGGNIKMKRNDIIQMSLQMIGMEIARIELTNDYVLLVNRYNKQFMKLSYDDIPYLRSNGVTFYTFQSLFWNEVFALGTNDMAPTEKAFTETRCGEETLLNTASQQVAIEFLVNSMSGMLKQTDIKPVQANAGLHWKYNGWTIVEGKSFPCDMRLSAAVQGNSVEVDFKLSRLRSDANLSDIRTNIDTKRYEEITAQRAMMMIQSLLN